MRQTSDHERDTGEDRPARPAESDDEIGSPEPGRDTLPGMPETDDDSSLGDSDQHSTA